MAERGDSGPANGEGQYFGPRANDPSAPEHQDDPGFVTRTRFLSGVALAAGGVMGAAIIVPVVGFAVVDPLKGEDFRWVDIGPASDFLKNPPGGGTNQVGGVTSIAVSGPDPEADRRVFVVFGPTADKASAKPADLAVRDMEILAIWNRCAHLGCPVSYGGGVFVCPCHGGAYDARGRVAAGPPPRPLDRFDVKITDGKRDVALVDAISNPSKDHRLLIGKPYSINADEKPFRLAYPGVPVDGVLANLYPF
ncbi:MAG: ubiquinol-cytochrome c reductase iron-sulfur subunit [Actinobacteria bacterium]|nr:ubiquinol-cytochrome c reductase iron-sulfur subunit [Actinomycetota bacterium]